MFKKEYFFSLKACVNLFAFVCCFFAFSSQLAAVDLKTKGLLDESLRILFSSNSPGYKRYLENKSVEFPSSPGIYLQSLFYSRLVERIPKTSIKNRVREFNLFTKSGMFAGVLRFFVRNSYELFSPDSSQRERANEDIRSIAISHAKYGVDLETVALFKEIVPSMVYDMLYDEDNAEEAERYRAAWLAAFDDVYKVWRNVIKPSEIKVLNFAILYQRRALKQLRTHFLSPLSESEVMQERNASHRKGGSLAQASSYSGSGSLTRTSSQSYYSQPDSSFTHNTKGYAHVIWP